MSLAQTVDVFVEFYSLSADDLVSNAVEFMYEGIDEAFASPAAPQDEFGGPMTGAQENKQA